MGEGLKRAVAATKATRKKPVAVAKIPLADVMACIPTSWLDSLLTGPDAVIGRPPYNCPDIERLLEGVRKRLTTLAENTQ